MNCATRAAVAGLGTLVIGVPGLGCGGQEKPSRTARPSTEVAAADFRFEPATVVVKEGATVTWTNTGRQIHNVKGPGFFSKAIDPGKRYQLRFEKAGRYRYLCTLHPQQMRATVTVKGPAKGGSKERSGGAPGY